MDDAVFEAMKKARATYHPIALRIPGVHGTSVGLKQSAGKLTQEFAIRIHLTRKRPPGQLTQEERIPSTIDGFPTDIIEEEAPEAHEDSSKRRPVLGGIQIAVGSHWGTLGCIVKDSVSGARWALSNQHVMNNLNAGVFQPKTDPVCDQIGTIQRTVLSSRVDGGVCSLNMYDVTSEAKIVDIGDVNGTYAVRWADLPYPVRKRGRTTLVTKGNITGLDFSGTRNDGWQFTGQQYIASAGPNPSGPNFSEPGDSGSAVIDEQGRVVGLLWGASTPNGCASPIADVMAELRISVVTTSEAIEPVPYDETLVGKLEAMLMQSQRGTQYWRTIRRNHTRLRHLFHVTPRLYAVWLDSPHASLVEAVCTAITDRDATVPSTLGGEDTLAVLGRLRGTLARYVKDQDLLKQIDSLYKLIEQNIGRRWEDALADELVGADQ